jgi:hypothetical protein
LNREECVLLVGRRIRRNVCVQDEDAHRSGGGAQACAQLRMAL